MSIETINEIGKQTKYFEFNTDDIGESLAELISNFNQKYVYQNGKYSYVNDKYFIKMIVPKNKLIKKEYTNLPESSIIIDVNNYENNITNTINFYGTPNNLAYKIAYENNLLYLNFNCQNSKNICDKEIIKNIKYFICYLVDYRSQNNLTFFSKKDLKTMQDYYILNILSDINTRISYDEKRKQRIKKFRPGIKVDSNKYSNDSIYKTIKKL